NTNGTPNPLGHRFVDSDFRAAVRCDRKSERGQARPWELDRATRVSRKRAAQSAARSGDRDQTGGRARTGDCSSAAFAGLGVSGRTGEKRGAANSGKNCRTKTRAAAKTAATANQLGTIHGRETLRLDRWTRPFPRRGVFREVLVRAQSNSAGGAPSDPLFSPPPLAFPPIIPPPNAEF